MDSIIYAGILNIKRASPAQFLGRLSLLLIVDSILTLLVSPVYLINFRELCGRSKRLNHVCRCETSAWCGKHRSARSESPSTRTTLDKDGRARCRRYEGKHRVYIFFIDRTVSKPHHKHRGILLPKGCIKLQSIWIFWSREASNVWNVTSIRAWREAFRGALQKTWKSNDHFFEYNTFG